MSIWGKIIGVTAGMMLGGPLGALIGGIGGHYYDKMKRQRGDDDDNGQDEQKRIAFVTAIIVLGAKMAKADGVVARVEVEAFKQAFQIPEAEMEAVGILYNKAKQDAGGYQPYALQVKQLFGDSPEILEELLHCLAHIAKADGVIHPNEYRFLREVAYIFAIDEQDFERITTIHSDQSFKQEQASSHAPSDRPSAQDYKILGVKQGASLKEVKAAYRKLAMRHHPDHLTAKGMPEEFIEQANQTMARINQAYERIEKHEHPS